MPERIHQTYRCHLTACIGLFSLISESTRLNPFCCFLKAASNVPYDTMTWPRDNLISSQTGVPHVTSDTHDIELFEVIRLQPALSMPQTDLMSDPRKRKSFAVWRAGLTVKPSAFFSISCFHCIRATTGATTKLGFFRGSDRRRAIVWILRTIAAAGLASR